MAHSKRNTSLPHFTSYERSLLRNSWGTQRGTIGRDSFLPFGSCRLCLHPSRAPSVACARNGDLFCRECAINDLLSQRKEISRLEKEKEEARRRIEEDNGREAEEARGREVKEFEMISMGFDDGGNANGNNKKKRKIEEEEGEGKEGSDRVKKKEKVCLIHFLSWCSIWDWFANGVDVVDSRNRINRLFHHSGCRR